MGGGVLVHWASVGEGLKIKVKRGGKGKHTRLGKGGSVW